MDTTVVRANPGSFLRMAVDQVGQAGAVEPSQVFDSAAVHWTELPRAGAAVAPDGSLAELAEHLLFPGRGRRNVPEPSGTERLYQAGSGARRRVCHGHLVPFDQYWGMAGGESRVVFQLDAPAEAVWDQRDYSIYCSRAAGVADPADQEADGRSLMSCGSRVALQALAE